MTVLPCYRIGKGGILAANRDSKMRCSQLEKERPKLLIVNYAKVAPGKQITCLPSWMT